MFNSKNLCKCMCLTFNNIKCVTNALYILLTTHPDPDIRKFRIFKMI